MSITPDPTSGNPRITEKRPHDDVVDSTRQGNANPIKFQEVAHPITPSKDGRPHPRD